MGALIARARQVMLTPLALVAAAVFVSVLVAVFVLGPLARAPIEESAPPTPHLLIRAAELQAIAPVTLAGLERASVKVQAASGMDVPALALDARYNSGAKRIDLKIVHSPDLERVIGFGGPATSDYDRKSDGGHQRRWRLGDAILLESVDPGTGAATYGRVNRDFYVLARGAGGISVDQLRVVVELFGDTTLQGLKHGG